MDTGIERARTRASCGDASIRRTPGLGVLLLLVLVVVGGGLLLAKSTPSEAGPTCSKTWTGAVSGNWSDNYNWSPSAVPDYTDDVCITVAGTYTITLDFAAQVNSFQIGSGGAGLATLVIEGDSCATSGELDVGTSAEVFANGQVTMTTVGCGGPVSLHSGELTNDGTIQVATGASGSASIWGDVTNTGTFDVDTALSYGHSGNTFDNQGTVSLGADMTVSGPATFVNRSGSLDTTVAARLEVFASTFEQRGGASTGNPVAMRNSTLKGLGTGTTSSGFIAEGGTNLSGGLAANQHLTVRGVGCDVAATVTVNGAFANAGTVDLLAVGCAGGNAVSFEGTDLFTNTGTFTSQAGTGGVRHIQVPLLNQGTVTISTPTGYDGDTQTFDNQGTLNVTAALTVPNEFRNTSGAIQAVGAGKITLSPGNTFTQDQGGADGNPIVLDSANVTFVDGAAGPTYFVVHGTSVLGGDVPADATITVEASGCAPTQPADLTMSDLDSDQETVNAGTIILSSSACTFESASITTPYLLENQGTIQSVGGSGGYRRISANLVNEASGIVQVDHPLDFINNPDPFYSPTIFTNEGLVTLNAVMAVYQNTFNHIAGSIDAPTGYLYVNDADFFQLYGETTGTNAVQIVNGSTLAFGSPGAPGTQHFLLRGDTAMTGDVPNTATVTIDAGTCVADTTVTTPGSFTNSGTIVLTSTATGCAPPGPKAKLAVGGDFNNAGTFTSATGLGGTRQVAAGTMRSSGLLGLQAAANLTVTGNLVLETTGTVIPTLASATSFGHADVTGAITLGGTLNPNTTYSPAYGDHLELFTYSDIVDRYAFDTVVTGGIDFVPEATLTMMRLSVLMPSQTTLEVTPSTPTVYGEPVTLQATVSTLPPNTGTPYATVAFFDGTTLLGYATVDAGGVAELTATNLSVDPAGSITAMYLSDYFVAVSTSDPVTHVTNLAPTHTTLSATPNPSTPGEMVTITATVTVDPPSVAVPGGLLAILDGAGLLHVEALPASGIVQFTTSSLPAGVHHLTASYSGDAGFQGSDSTEVDQEVGAEATTVVASSTPNPSVTGQPVAFTATVTADGTGDPATGQVSFVDTTTSTTLSTTTLDAGGVAHLNIASLSVGTHAVEARYLGTGLLAPSVATASQVVNKAATTTSIIKLPNPAVSGQTVTIKATISPVAPGGLTPSGGTVTFYDGATALGTATVDASGVATFASSSFSKGSHTIIATFNGDASYLTSSQNSGVLFVDFAETTTALVVTPSAPVAGEPVVLAATVAVSAPGTGLPTGNVQFQDGATILGTVALNGSGQAQLTTSTLSIGAHALTATYLGDASVGISQSPTVNRTVAKASSATALVGSPSPSLAGQSVTFTATVNVAAPGTGTATGNVQFTEGATVLGTSALSGAGVATMSTSALTNGTHPIVATYLGDTRINGSASTPFSQIVGQSSTSTSLISSANPSVAGQSVDLTATVAGPAAPIPTGTVTFRDGATVLATVGLDASGSAVLSTAGLSVASHSIVATYNGDSSFTTSTSATLAQVVDKADTTIGTGLAPSVAVVGESVIISSQVFVNPPGAVATKTGTMTFRAGATVLGSSPVDASGFASLTTTVIPIGSPSITAQYSGNANLSGATSPAQIATVSKASTAAALASSANPSSLGEEVTFTATVTVGSPGSGTPTGLVTFSDGVTTLGTAPVSAAGEAVLAIDTLPIGATAVHATYAGDTNFTGSTSNSVAQQVNEVATTTSLTSSPNPSLAFQEVTFTATVAVVAPATGTPTGDVIFSDGPFTLGSAPVDGTGHAELKISSLQPNTHSVIAHYLGDAATAPSDSSPHDQVVNQLPTSTSLVSSPNPSVSAELVTLTANVTTSGGPTVGAGTVSFTDNGSFLGSATVTAGVAEIQTNGLKVGSRAIEASYAGVFGLGSSTSNTVTQVVTEAATTTALVSSPNPSAPGGPVELTATVTVDAPGNGLATGDVTFTEGATVLGTGPLDASGVATFSTTTLPVGTHSLTATFGGDAELTGSTSNSVDQEVAAGTSSTALTSSGTTVFGEPVTFTATITAPGTPTGTVTFTNGATPLGTSPVVAGQAKLAISTLPVGTFGIVATYSGDAVLDGSASPIFPQTVQRASSSTALSSSPNPSTFGEQVTFTAQVSVVAPGSGTPTGQVNFSEGATMLASVPVDGSGQAELTTDSLSAGTHTIRAFYVGSGQYDSSFSATIDQEVGRVPTSTALTATPNPSVAGETVTFEATVTGPGAVVPTGQVRFNEGATMLGLVPVDAAGVGRLLTGSLPVGTHTVTATYLGDAQFDASTSSSAGQVVTKATSATSLSASPNPSGLGGSVTFTASVAVVAPGAGTPTGSVTFTEGAITLGTGTVSAAGEATFSTSALAVGTHSVVATYAGDASFVGSASTSVDQVVTTGSSATLLSSSPSPSVSGEVVTFSASVAPVAPASGTATGTVRFSEGATTFAVVPLTAGAADWSVSTLSVGSHLVVATYSGDGNLTGSASTSVDQVVNKAATSTSLSSTPNPSGLGTSVTFTATVTVTAPGSGTPTGQVTFHDGATLLGSGPVSAGQAQLTISSLSVGTHPVVATYVGDAERTTSDSPSVGQVVTAGSTSTSLAASPNPSVAGELVTFTATVAPVAPASGAATGSVVFTEGATVLGTVPLANGSAELPVSALAVGSHPVVATYVGDVNLGGSASVAVDQVVEQAATSTSLSSSPNPSGLGGSVTFTATVTVDAPGSGTPTGSVTFTEGAITLGTGTVSAAGEATFSTTALAVGTHSVVATYAGDASFVGSASTSVDQVVTTGSSATLLSSSPSPSVSGEVVTFSASVAPVAPATGTATGTVTFSDGATTLGTAPLTAGSASLALSTLSVGSHPVVATYSGDANLTGSASTSVDQVVNKAATSTSLSSTTNPSGLGESVSFTATVTVTAPGSGSPTGSVTFTEGATTLGAGAVSAAGEATFSTTALAVGTHSVVATYGGNAELGGSAAVPVDQVVHGPTIPSSTSLSAAPAGLVATQPFDLTAQVTSTVAVSGSVELRDGSTLLGTSTLAADGRAAFALTHGLGAGTHQLTATYLGTNVVLPSTSPAVVATVGRAQGVFTTTAFLDPAHPGTVTFLVVATAKAPASSAPAGTIELRQGDEVIGYGPLVRGRAEIRQCFTAICLPPTTTTTTTTIPTSTSSTTSSSTTTTSSTTTSSTTSSTTAPTTTTSTTVVPTTAVPRMLAAVARPAVAIRSTSLAFATRAASTVEVVASYPGDNDFDAYASDPIPVSIDGDTVSLPDDTPPPVVTTTTVPTTRPPATVPNTSSPANNPLPPNGDPTVDPTGVPTTTVDGQVDDVTDEAGASTTTTTAPDGTADDGDGESASGATPGRIGQDQQGTAETGSERPQSLSSQFGRSTLSSSTANPSQISTDPAFILENVLLTLFLLLFSVYPAYVINNTLAENYDEVLGWFGPVDRRITRFREKRGHFSAGMVLGLSAMWGAILYSFLDPNIGLNMPSAALFCGLFASTLLISGVYDVARKRYLHHHYGIVSSLRGYPVGVIIGIILVVFSRVGHFTPGYLFGVFTALGFSTAIDRRHDGKGVAAAAFWLLIVAAVSWFLWVPVADAASKPDAGFLPLFLDTTLATTWVVGIQAVVFGLMPLRFLDGEKVWYWSKAAWAAIYGLGMFAFVHSMVRPGEEVSGDSYVSALLLFVGFSLFALGFWAYFRFRTSDPGDLERPTEGPEHDELVGA